MKAVNKFGKPRLLIIGCGDVGMRLLPLVRDCFRVIAVTSQVQRLPDLRAHGALGIVANLDDPDQLYRLRGFADTVVHLAPPPNQGTTDRRTRNLLRILPRGARLVYVSTTGVYGDCAGAQFDEARPVSPKNARAVRRVDAERALRQWAKRTHARLAILRVPGIYAEDRLPIERLRQGTPALLPEQDVFTNHIHADDLARIIAVTLRHGAPQRVYHAVDDSDMKMGDYFDAVADAFALPRPPRVSREALSTQVSPMLLSFMSESRRLKNDRMRQELGVRLQYPTVDAFLSQVNKRHENVS